MSDVSITDLIARMRHDFEPSNSFANASLSDVMNAAADALESSEQRANAAEREMHARELHHFEAEELLAAAQATIAEAVCQTRRGNIATPPWVVEALTQSTTDALEAVKATAWRRGTLDLHATVSEYMPETKPPVNPYSTASIEGEKP